MITFVYAHPQLWRKKQKDFSTWKDTVRKEIPELNAMLHVNFRIINHHIKGIIQLEII